MNQSGYLDQTSYEVEERMRRVCTTVCMKTYPFKTNNKLNVMEKGLGMVVNLEMKHQLRSHRNCLQRCFNRYMDTYVYLLKYPLPNLFDEREMKRDRYDLYRMNGETLRHLPFLRPKSSLDQDRHIHKQPRSTTHQIHPGRYMNHDIHYYLNDYMKYPSTYQRSKVGVIAHEESQGKKIVTRNSKQYNISMYHHFKDRYANDSEFNNLDISNFDSP